MRSLTIAAFILVATLKFTTGEAQAGFIEYGSEINPVTGLAYTPDSKAGATLMGLSANTVTLSTNVETHGYPFAQPAGSYPGTDQIYVGSHQTAFDDGYSVYAGRIAGPQIITMDYSSLVPAGQVVSTLTLGIAADDFQYPTLGQPFSASINNTANNTLSAVLNSFDDRVNGQISNPLVHFFTIGISTTQLLSNNTLTLTIDEGGNGGDGWAVDFLTIGVTTAPAIVPEPSSLALCSIAAVAGLVVVRIRCKHS